MNKLVFTAILSLSGSCTDPEIVSTCQDFPHSYADIFFERANIHDVLNAEYQIYSARSEVAKCYPRHPYDGNMYILNYRGARSINERDFLEYDIEDATDIYLLFEFDDSGKIIGSFVYGFQ